MSEEAGLSTLRDPVVFVFGYADHWRDVFEDPDAVPPVDEIHSRFSSPEENWVMQAFLRLRQKGLNVSLSPRFVEGQINVVSYHHLLIRAYPYRSYVVTVTLQPSATA